MTDPEPAAWSVYLIRCADDTLYTGIARDPARRLAEHIAGTGSRYLRGRGPLTLAWAQVVGERGPAQAVEARIKRLPRRDKDRLVEGTLRLDSLPG